MMPCIPHISTGQVIGIRAPHLIFIIPLNVANKNPNIEMPFHRIQDFSIELMVTHTPLQNMAKVNLYILQHA